MDTALGLPNGRRSGLPIVRIQQLLNPYAVADLFTGSLDSRYRIDTGDLVMSWSGTIAVVQWDRGPAWLNQHLFRVDAKAEVEAAFLKHLLDSRLGHLEAAAHGTTMKHIKRGDLLKHEVPVPPLEEQRRIAEILDTIDETIQATERVIAKLRGKEWMLLTRLSIPTFLVPRRPAMVLIRGTLHSSRLVVGQADRSARQPVVRLPWANTCMRASPYQGRISRTIAGTRPYPSLFVLCIDNTRRSRVRKGTTISCSVLDDPS